MKSLLLSVFWTVGLLLSMRPALAEEDYSAPHFTYFYTQPEQVVLPGGKTATVSYEVFAASSTTIGDTEAAKKWLALNLYESTSTAPAMVPKIVLVSETDTETQALRNISDEITEGHKAIVAEEALPEHWSRTVGPAFKDWFKKNYRITFALSRAVINGSVTTWGLVISPHIPLPAAIPIGIAVGAFSGTFQYMNAKVQKWLVSKGVLEKVFLNGKTQAAGLLKTALHSADEYLRWYGLEVSFLTVINVAMAGLGISPHAGLVDAAQSILTTSAYSLAAQGFWDLGIAKSTRLALDRSPLKAARIQFLSDLKGLTVSAFSVTFAVASTMGLEIAEAGFIGMTVTGVANYVYGIWSRWKNKRAASKGKLSNTTAVPVCDPKIMKSTS